MNSLRRTDQPPSRTDLTLAGVAGALVLAGCVVCGLWAAGGAGSTPGNTASRRAIEALAAAGAAASLALAATVAAGLAGRSRRAAMVANRRQPNGPGQAGAARTRTGRARHVMGSPIMGFAVLLIAFVWATAYWQQSTERAADVADLTSDAENMARIISQNVERAANELDKTLKYIRRSHERAGYAQNWASLLSDEYTASDVTVQIAAIDGRGMMISSTAMLHPAKPVDLSDREHFRALRDTTGDPLYISRPMVGRASGKVSVQFARRVFDINRAFDGIIVASLTTDYLTNAFGEVSLGTGSSGIALFGQDGTVRAGSGVYAAVLGEQVGKVIIRDVEGLDASMGANLGSTMARQVLVSQSGSTAVATLPVTGHPLAIRVVLADESREFKRITRGWLYVIGSGAATLAILYAAMTSVYNRQSFEARIVRLAHFDALTGIANRAHFKAELNAAYARPASEGGFALHLIDLDGFKFVNDSHGHPVGDQLLKVVAGRLRKTLRDYDHLARLGGDEFAIIQNRIGAEEQAAALARRVCEIIGAPYSIEGYTVSIGASVGIAMFRDAPNARDLMKAADLALYEAKRAGRGRFQFFDRKIEAAYLNQRRAEADLKAAIENEEFVLHYQPIVDIESGRTTGYEALVRWWQPGKGFVPPGDFIPLAEETGLIVPLGEWILRRAVADMAAADPEATIAVNCSPLQFKSVNFMAATREALEASGLEPRRLVMEITESILMTQDNATIAHLNALQDLGVRLSLDDFGTGYSSLSYVIRYPFSVVKIDRSFTAQLCTDVRSASVVRAICALARSLDMRTIAEGVETAEQLEALRALGCEGAQGFYFSRPKPAAELFGGDGRIAAAAE